MFNPLPAIVGVWDTLRLWLESVLWTPLCRAWNKLTSGVTLVSTSVGKLRISFGKLLTNIGKRFRLAIELALSRAIAFVQETWNQFYSVYLSALIWLKSRMGEIHTFFSGASTFWFGVYQNYKGFLSTFLANPISWVGGLFVRAVQEMAEVLLYLLIAVLNKIW
jgi:hypothetical protein